MPVIRNQEETAQLKAFNKRSTRGELLFNDLISQLEVGQSLQIEEGEWPRKSSPSLYYALRVNKPAGKKLLKVTAVKGGWIIEKVA